MAEEKVKLVTPVGELWYVNITGQGKKNYNEDGYNYVATVHLTGELALALKAKIDEILGPVPKGKTIKSTGCRELLKDADGNIFTPTKNKTEGEPTGIYAFTYTTNAVFADGRPTSIAVYNKDRKKVDMDGHLIGNGSKGAISGVAQRFERGKEVGVSLFLKAVQLTEYVAYTGDAGFEEQDGTFEVPDEDNSFSSVEDSEQKAATQETAKPRL